MQELRFAHELRDAGCRQRVVSVIAGLNPDGIRARSSEVGGGEVIDPLLRRGVVAQLVAGVAVASVDQIGGVDRRATNHCAGEADADDGRRRNAGRCDGNAVRIKQLQFDGDRPLFLFAQ